MAFDRIAVWEQISALAEELNLDPRLLVGAVLLLGAALGLLLFWLVRRRSSRRRQSSKVYLSGDSPAQRRNAVQSIQQTLKDLRREDPEFVDLMQAILKCCPLDRLLQHDEAEVAFGRLSFLFEKRRVEPKRRTTTLLAPPDNPRDLHEKRAAMLTVVRCCYASDVVYSSLDEKARLQIDRFLDRFSASSR